MLKESIEITDEEMEVLGEKIDNQIYIYDNKRLKLFATDGIGKKGYYFEVR